MRSQYTHSHSTTQDFYPTPPHLIARMLSAVDWRTVSSVLEPSAGKGDLADAIARRLDGTSRYHRATLDCIEIDPTLQHILRGKGHTVVHDDFLTFRTATRYDLIVANFPFSDGDSHLLHALDLLRAGGGQLVALVNAETFRNRYTRQRERLFQEIRELGADIAYLQDQFADAERPTDVEVALVVVRVPADPQPSILLDGLRDADDDTPYDAAHRADLVAADPVANMLARFALECRAGAKLIAEYDALTPLMLNRLPLAGDTDRYAGPPKPIIRLEVAGDAYGTDRVNAYVRATRHKYWHALIGNPTFRAGYTSAILTALDGKLDDLRHKDFTAFNIRQLEAELRGELPGSIEDAILALFDDLSRKYAYIDGTGNNVHYYTGWKTNRAHKINAKVIIPINGFGAYSRGKLDAYKVAEKLADMVKVFQYLAGEPIDADGIASRAIAAANEADRFRNIDFHYFTATFFKKGTCHIRFKPEHQDLLDKFNIFGSQKRGWLPPSYGRRAYRDMDAEERAVIDDFQGAAAYAEVLARRDYYLSAVALPQLESVVAA